MAGVSSFFLKRTDSRRLKSVRFFRHRESRLIENKKIIRNLLGLLHFFSFLLLYSLKVLTLTISPVFDSLVSLSPLKQIRLADQSKLRLD